jgi:hypothetical protein
VRAGLQGAWQRTNETANKAGWLKTELDRGEQGPSVGGLFCCGASVSQRRQLQAVMTSPSTSGPVLHTCGQRRRCFRRGKGTRQTRPTTQTVTHAGIVATTVYELTEPTIPPDPAMRIVP